MGHNQIETRRRISDSVCGTTKNNAPMKDSQVSNSRASTHHDQKTKQESTIRREAETRVAEKSILQKNINSRFCQMTLTAKVNVNSDMTTQISGFTQCADNRPYLQVI